MRARSALAVAVLATLGACAFLEPQSPLARTIERVSVEPARLFAGAARVALTPVARPVPLAGFGPRPAFATEVERAPGGERLELAARAVSLRTGLDLDHERDRVVLASVDQLVVTADFRARVRRELRALTASEPELDTSQTELVVAATHTHSGIGGFWPGALPEWTSVGPYDPERTALTAHRTALACLAAIKAERPARLARARVDLPDLVSSRAAHTSLTDPELLALAFDDDGGHPIARVVVFASHPTELYGTDRLSPCWPGAACEALERAGGVTLVFQGGLGDQRPAFPPRIWDGFTESWPEDEPRPARSRAYGFAVGRAAADALEGRPRAEASVLRLAHAPFALPFPTLGACPIPILDRLLAIPVALPYWPDETRFVVLRVGDALIAFAPFELCATTSLRLKARLRAAGFEDAAVVSLANDWLGYAPDGIPWPWTTSGLTSFGGTGMGYVIGDRLAAMGEAIAR
jgi:hypothetical protein